MHNIVTPELPAKVLVTRNEFIEEQKQAQRAREMQEV
jgi:hypothetical protein